jgi:hypothetical protein
MPFPAPASSSRPSPIHTLVLSSLDDQLFATSKAEFLIPLAKPDHSFDGRWLVTLDAAVVPLREGYESHLPAFSTVLLLSRALSQDHTVGLSQMPVVAVFECLPTVPKLSLLTVSRYMSLLPDTLKAQWLQGSAVIDLKLTNTRGEILTANVIDFTKEIVFIFRLLNQRY